MAGFLRQSTAVDLLIGPFVDEDDGKTLEESLTISQGDVMLSKNGQPLAQKSDNTACAFDDFGCYNCELDATDTNTVGQLTVVVFEDGALPFRSDYQVVEGAVYDMFYADAATGAVPVASIAANAITATSIAAEAGTEIAAAIWNALKATYNAVGSFGHANQDVIRQNTATAGGAATITLDGSASSTTDFYVEDWIKIIQGTGSAGQPRRITAYNGTTKVATVDPAWDTQPDATSEFAIF